MCYGFNLDPYSGGDAINDNKLGIASTEVAKQAHLTARSDNHGPGPGHRGENVDHVSLSLFGFTS